MEVFFYLELMAILYDINSPRSIVFLCMIQPRQAAFGKDVIDSLWDDIMVLQIKSNQNLAAISGASSR